MSDIPPIPQQPSDRGVARPGRERTRSVLNGLCAGVVLSAIIWIVGFSFVSNDTVMVMSLVAVGLKYLVAILLVFIREWRSFALGLFASLPLGAVIFFGVCG